MANYTDKLRWQPLQSNIADPSSSIYVAGNLFNNAIEGLQGIVDKRQAFETGKYLNELSVSEDPDSLREAILGAADNPWLDLDQVREAGGARLDSLNKAASDAQIRQEDRAFDIWKHEDTQANMNARALLKAETSLAGKEATLGLLNKDGLNIVNHQLKDAFGNPDDIFSDIQINSDDIGNLANRGKVSKSVEDRLMLTGYEAFEGMGLLNLVPGENGGEVIPVWKEHVTPEMQAQYTSALISNANDVRDQLVARAEEQAGQQHANRQHRQNTFGRATAKNINDQRQLDKNFASLNEILKAIDGRFESQRADYYERLNENMGRTKKLTEKDKRDNEALSYVAALRMAYPGIPSQYESKIAKYLGELAHYSSTKKDTVSSNLVEEMTADLEELFNVIHSGNHYLEEQQARQQSFFDAQKSVESLSNPQEVSPRLYLP